MTSPEDEGQQGKDEEGGATTTAPPSAVDSVEEDDGAEDAEPIAVPLPEVREVVLREVSQAISWRSDLPLPDHYDQYKKSDDDLSVAIKERFRSQTALEVRVAEAGIDSINRELRLKERDQDLRIEESHHDMHKSDQILKLAPWSIPFLVISALIVFFLGPDGTGTIIFACTPCECNPCWRGDSDASWSDQSD